MSEVELRTASVGSMDNNVYVLVDSETQESILVDAPTDADRIQSLLDGTAVRYIILTHGDADHIQALPQMKALTGAPVAIHPADADRLPFPADRLIEDGDVFEFGGSYIRILHTPGHTPGSISLVVGGMVLSGDTLFPGGPGNTKRPGGDFQAIIAAIRDKLLPLPDNTKVYPGHGKPTTIGEERPHLQEWIDRGW